MGTFGLHGLILYVSADPIHLTQHTVRALPAVGAGVEHAEALVQHADGLVLVSRVVVGVVALAQREAGLKLWNAFGNTTEKRTLVSTYRLSLTPCTWCCTPPRPRRGCTRGRRGRGGWPAAAAGRAQS